MLPALDIGRGFFATTAFRILSLLTIVLAPIGLIAVFQTQALNAKLVREVETAQLARVVEASKAQREVINRAVGAAETLGAITRDFDFADPGCGRVFADHVSKNDAYTYAGLLPSSGVITCSSVPGSLDLSDHPHLADVFEADRVWIDADDNGRASQAPVVAIGVPIQRGGELSHFSVVSFPQQAIVPSSAGDPELFEASTALLLFNTRGKILFSRNELETVDDRLPAGIDLSDLAGSARVFLGENQAGEAKVFAVAPLYDDVAFVMASWPPDVLYGSTASLVAPWVFPILMWLTTLAVAYVAINRLVLRHTKLLGLRMRRFAQNRRLPDLGISANQPLEFAEMDRNFRNMAQSILRDEASLENALHEKNALLREVHHRVKNNLQLIASIMNMQIRKSRNSETGVVVRRLQDRVLSLAAVHQKIYQAETLSRIGMKDLLEDILQKTLYVSLRPDSGIDVDADFAEVYLHPDQAVPLALLLAEASTNAVKYAGSPPDSDRVALRIRLEKDDYGHVSFTFANTKGEMSQEAQDAAGVSTLGTQLIRAFCTQLGGDMNVEETETEYRLSTRFEVAVYREYAEEVSKDGEPTAPVRT